MRVITNPGSNVPEDAVAQYGIAMTPSKIVVDGVEHDARNEIPGSQIDGWVATAREHPYVLGTSATEFVKELTTLLGEDPEVLVLTSSRKIITTYDSAVSAARTLSTRPAFHDATIRIADSGSTDIGAGLLAIFAGEAARAGLGVDVVADLVEILAGRLRFGVIPRRVDYLIKGGRAGFLRGWMAKMLGLRPILSFQNGEVSAAGKCSADDDFVQVLVDFLTPGVRARRVWVGVAHGDVPDDAARLLDALRERFDVAYAVVRRVSPTIYLHTGGGMLGAVIYPMEGLPWLPPVPPGGA